MYTHIVFDIDGTILDSDEGQLKGFSSMYHAVTGKYLRPEECHFIFGQPDEAVLSIVGLVPSDEISRLWDEGFSQYSHTVKPFPGVMEHIGVLKEQGVHIGIITARRRAQLNLDNQGLFDTALFEHVICADDTERSKPFSDPMLHYLFLSGAKPEEVLYIGDTASDCQCAQGAGCAFGLVLWGRSISQAESIGADFLLRAPEELLTLSYDLLGKQCR